MATELGVTLTKDVRPPVTDPTLGIAVPATPHPRPAAHRLVTIGDSLTQGFQHFSIFNTSMSWPAIVAYQLGASFDYPTWDGPGGHPLNLEYVARRLHAHPLGSAIDVYRLMHEVERYYEFGDGAVLPGMESARNENLAIWGWDLRDCLVRTADYELGLIAPPRPNIVPFVDNSGERAAVSVLNSARGEDGSALTPIGAARRLGQDPGGIETLCVWLGANNVLGSVVELRAELSGPDFQDVEKKSAYTIWTPEHFAIEFELVAEAVRSIDAQHVLWATVPHVTIPPITRGLGDQLVACPRYLEYYGRPWQEDDTFHPQIDRNLTGKQAWAIDVIIDHYNRTIEHEVRRARREGRDWRIVDMCASLDRLAVRRNEDLHAAPDWIDEVPDPRPPLYQDLNARFFRTDDQGRRTSGGLFGMDGVHPTTAGYAIVANEFIKVMDGAGVSFDGPDGATVDFQRVLFADTLNSDPPRFIASALTFLRKVDQYADLYQRLRPHRLPF